MPPPACHPAALPPAQLERDCGFERLRRSGPGGQHRNKVETAVLVTHRPTGVMAEANERRSQAANRQAALFRLRVRLALAVRSPVDAIESQYPSDLWSSRVKSGRLVINPSHSDFPALLAEALDVLLANDWESRAAADTLGVSGTQLVRLLSHEPAALQLLNEQRQHRGLRPLR